MRKLRTGDTVKVMKGRSRGTIGKVKRIIRKNGMRVVVEGANVAKKHVKPNPNINEQGGIKEIDMPMAIANVAIYNQATGKADRVGFKQLEDGRRVRIYKSTQETIDS